MCEKEIVNNGIEGYFSKIHVRQERNHNIISAYLDTYFVKSYDRCRWELVDRFLVK